MDQSVDREPGSSGALWVAARAFLTKPLPGKVGWPHVLGSAAVFLFLLQGITGVLLAFNYVPSPD